jgi:hypothetical protein
VGRIFRSGHERTTRSPLAGRSGNRASRRTVPPGEDPPCQRLAGKRRAHTGRKRGRHVRNKHS